MAVHGRAHPVPAVISRNSLQDVPVLTTPAPVIRQAAATAGYGQPGPPLISVAPFIPAAAPALATPAPVVVSAQPPGVPPAQALTSRNSLADAPVLTTRPPLIAGPAATPGFGSPGPPLISSAPFIPVAAPAAPTPAPLVTWQQPPPVPPAQALTSRSSLADAPVLTTPPPVVVMARVITPQGSPQAAIITAAPAVPPVLAASTPQPIVIAAAVKLAAAQPPVILRSTLADAPVLTTPLPVVVAQPVRWPPTFPLISSAPFIAPPPPFTVGTLTASSLPGSTLTTRGAASMLAAFSAPLGVLTASSAPGAVATVTVLGLLDEVGSPVLDEASGFILLEDGS